MSKIIDVLNDLLQSEPLGTGAGNVVYAFPEESGLGRYVLRMPKNFDLKKALNESTALVPVTHLVGDANIGQPLMVLDGNNQVAIHLKQTGESFVHFEERVGKESAAPGLLERNVMGRASLAHHLVELQHKTGVNPFRALFEQAVDLTMLGLKADFSWNNIHFDEAGNQLVLVDQTDRLPETDARNIPQKIEELRGNSVYRFKFLFQSTPEELRGDVAAAVRMIDDAARDTLLARGPNASTKIAFAKVSNTAGVKLEGSSQALLVALDRLAADATISQRA